MFVKTLTADGIPPMQALWSRYTVHTVLILLIFMPRSGLAILRTRHPRLQLTRGALLLGMTALYFTTLKYLPFAEAVSILQIAPLMITVMAALILHEKIGPWRWFAIGLGFVGVLCVVRPFGAGFHWASALIVYNATALALFSIITRKLSGEVATQVMQIWAGAMGTLVLLPLAIWSWQPISGTLTWALYLAIGAFAWTGHEIFARAHRYADVSLLMPFSYSYLVYMAGAGWLLFGALPDGMTLVGAGIIVVSGLIIWWRENRPGGAT